MRRDLVAFGTGLVFAIGLALGGMTQPAKVVAFLDLTGAWDPSLAFVMVGAIAVFAVAARLSLRFSTPLFAPAFSTFTTRIDRRLVAGAAIFGVGWGLAGFCPGPGVASLGAGSLPGLTFVVAMAAGMLLVRLAERARTRESGASAFDAGCG